MLSLKSMVFICWFSQDRCPVISCRPLRRPLKDVNDLMRKADTIVSAERPRKPMPS